MRATDDPAYTERLLRKSNRPWKRWLGVQSIYRWNLRQLNLGFVLDLGCGLGRHLAHLDGNGVGVDHNVESVRHCRDQGLRAFTPEAFLASPWAKPQAFDSLLASHLVEHMTFNEALELLRQYIPYLKTGGKLVLITPQAAGFRSDPTHVEPVDAKAQCALAAALGLQKESVKSFPFPFWVGAFFKHNETVGVFRQ